MVILEQHKYVKADHKKNNNKFWYITRFDDNSVLTEYGRMGNTPQKSHKNFNSEYAAKKFIDKKCKSKEKPKSNGEIAYRKLDVIDSSTTVTISPNVSLKEIAKSQITTDSPETVKLVEYLSECNVHTILENTTMTYNKQSGLFETVCGIVTQDTINKARNILVKVSDVISKDDKTLLVTDEYGEILNNYLMLIPQDIGRKYDPTKLYTSTEDIIKQNDILDSLEASIKMVQTAITDTTSTVVQETPQIFDTKLTLVNDDNVIDYINKLYHKTNQSMHACSHLKIKKIYSVEIANMVKAFINDSKDIGTIWELWHGTKVSNLLSILKQGLIVPPSNASHVCGRMFGNGIYFSDQSTKALNYAYGYWGGSRDNNCFMFVADVAMGKYFVPTGPRNQQPPSGYDSIYAKGRQSGVQNNEMIVPKVSQCNLKYLVQFGK